MDSHVDMEKQRLDAEVQTDFEYLNLKDDSMASSVCDNLKNEDVSSSDTRTTVSTCSTTNNQKREIRLKRNNTSNIPEINTQKRVEKKAFRWHKRRNQSTSRSQTYTIDKKSNSDGHESVTSKLIENSLSNTVKAQKEFDESIDIQASTSGVELNTDNMNTNGEGMISNMNTNGKGMISNMNTNGGGMISNMNTNGQGMISNLNNKNNETPRSKHVMFEVTGKDMEEYLKLKCDEWVSRFLQIMEEVLTQVLQREPPFKDDCLLPPWTVHEAAECIKKKFATDCDVVDAASKLSEILFKISDDKGKIKTNITPSEYMEMYSYGVYLLDSLQSILDHCEDLQTGSESLYRLFNDISNPHVESSNNVLIDSFVDNLQESVPNITPVKDMSMHDSQIIPKSDISIQEKTQNVTLHGTKRKKIPQKNREAYCLRSSKKKTIQENTETQLAEQPVKFIRTIDTKSSFFASLLLERKTEQQTGNVTQQYANFLLDTSELDNKESESQLSIENSTENVKNGSSDNINVDVKRNNEPKIIRNFTKCLELEERLKNRCRELLDLDELNYDDQDFNEEFYEDEHYSEDDYEGEQAHETEITEDIDINGVLHERIHDNYNQETNNDNIFKLFISTILKEINEIFTQVHTFCVKAREEISESRLSSKHVDLLDKAKKSHLVIRNLRESLIRIINREKNKPDEIQTAFRAAGLNSVVLTDTQLTEYRNVVRKSMDHASLLLEAIDLIINLVQNNTQDYTCSLSGGMVVPPSNSSP